MVSATSRAANRTLIAACYEGDRLRGFFFKQKTAYEIQVCLEFRRVLFRSSGLPRAYSRKDIVPFRLCRAGRWQGRQELPREARAAIKQTAGTRVSTRTLVPGLFC